MTNKILQLCFKLALLFAITSLQNITAYDNKALLINAMEWSRTSNYIATTSNPFLEVQGEDQRIPYAPDWKVYRQFRDGKLFLRLDTMRDKRNIVSYLLNGDGIFGRFEEGFAAEIIEVPQLWHLELSHQPIPTEEWKYSECTSSIVSYRGKVCYKVVVKATTDPALRRQLTGEDEETFKSHQADYRSRGVAVWEFLIDATSPFIYNRKHFNADGKLIFEVDLGTVELSPTFDPGLFATFDRLRGTFLERNEFIRKMLDRMIAREQPSFIVKLWQTLIKHCRLTILRHFDSITARVTVFFVVLAVAALLSIAFIRWHGRKK